MTAMFITPKVLLLRATRVVCAVLLVSVLCRATPSVPSPGKLPATERIEAYIKAIGAYQNQGHFDSSLVVIREAIQLARSQKLSQYYSELYRYLGYYYKANNEVEKAISLYRTAYYWCVKNRQTDKVNWLTYRLASVYVDRCLIHQEPENFKIALRQIHKNLNLPASRQTPYNLVCNYGLLVHLYQIYNNDSLYLHYLKKVIAINKTREKVPKDLFFNLIDEFGLYLGKGEQDKAGERFQRVLHMNEKKDFSFVYSLYLIDMLTKYVNKGYYDEAEKNIELILRDRNIMSALGESDLMNLYYCQTRINLHEGNFEQARINHRKCKSYIKKELFSWIKLNILENELTLLEHDNKYKEALALQKQIAEEESNRNRNQAIFELAASQERFEMQNVARELNDQLKIQKLENKNKEDNLRQARQIQWLTLSIIAILFLVLLLIYWQYNRIKKQSVELAALNKQQNTLFGIIGHDLRSPVANLQNFLRTFKDSRNQQEVPNLLADLEIRVGTLYNTLDNLLNWSIVQMDSLTVQCRRVSVAECAGNVLELLQPQMDKKSITVLTDLDAHWVWANEHLLEIVIRNLLHNAIKFTPRQGFIKLYSVQEDSLVTLVIQDSGKGFSPVHAADLANMQRLPGTDGETGTGLGLKLCRDLLKKLGGELRLISQPNQGGTVQVRLPGSSLVAGVAQVSLSKNKKRTASA